MFYDPVPDERIFSSGISERCHINLFLKHSKGYQLAASPAITHSFHDQGVSFTRLRNILCKKFLSYRRLAVIMAFTFVSTKTWYQLAVIVVLLKLPNGSACLVNCKLICEINVWQKFFLSLQFTELDVPQGKEKILWKNSRLWGVHRNSRW